MGTYFLFLCHLFSLYSFGGIAQDRIGKQTALRQTAPACLNVPSSRTSFGCLILSNQCSCSYFCASREDYPLYMAHSCSTSRSRSFLASAPFDFLLAVRRRACPYDRAIFRPPECPNDRLELLAGLSDLWPLEAVPSYCFFVLFWLCPCELCACVCLLRSLGILVRSVVQLCILSQAELFAHDVLVCARKYEHFFAATPLDH